LISVSALDSFRLIQGI